MVLYIIGLGLYGEKDISVRGLEIVRSSDYIYMEYYTSILGIDLDALKKFYEKDIILADREMIENDFDEVIMSKAKETNVSLLVVGDPFSATTHMDLFMRCNNNNVKVEVLNNASIMNSCGVTGMSLYRFGETVTIPYFTKNWRPYSFYEKILKNYQNDFHTLVLLDIKVKEISEENLAKGKKIYEAPRFMTVNLALEQLREAEDYYEKGLVTDDTLVYGIARIGSPTQLIVSGKFNEIIKIDFGGPLHSVVICAPSLHSMEKEVFQFYNNNNNKKV
jgi:diphthine synthase